MTTKKTTSKAAVTTKQVEKIAEEDAKVAEENRISALAREVLEGKHGRGEDRKKSLGKDFEQVTQEVIRLRLQAGGK